MPALTHRLAGRSITIEGTESLYFSGTSYLGMQEQADFRALIEEGLRTYGTHYGGSRHSPTAPTIYEIVESYLAKQHQAPAALTCSSGTVAGQLALRSLEEDTFILHAPCSHPAIIPSRNKQQQASSFEAFVTNLPKLIQAAPAQSIAICCNAIDPLYAIANDFGWIQGLPKDRQFIVIIDDSHGIGISGPEGEGIYSSLAVPEHVELIVVASLGKAYGIPAGVLFGTKDRLHSIEQQAFFGGASPANPAFLYAFYKAKEIYQRQRQRLIQNIQLFQSLLPQKLLFTYIVDYPVFYTSQQALAEFLQQRQIIISSFAYPRATDPVITRIVLNSLHQAEDVHYLSRSILEFINQ